MVSDDALGVGIRVTRTPLVCNMILSNYKSWATDILHVALYTRYGELWDAFSESIDIYYLFSKNLGIMYNNINKIIKF